MPVLSDPLQPRYTVSMQLTDELTPKLNEIRSQSLWKTERPIISSQSAHIAVERRPRGAEFLRQQLPRPGGPPRTIAAAKEALDSHGLGMASVRFICGTSDLHIATWRRLPPISAWRIRSSMPPVSMPMAGCSSPCSARRTRLFRTPEPRLDHRWHSALKSQALSLCQWRHGRSGDAVGKRGEGGARRIIVVTDGVFSMDGYFAKLGEIRALADRYDALHHGG